MPFRSVLTTCCTLVPVLTTVATALNTGSPCGSVTVPERLPPAPAHRLQPNAARANPAETQDLDLKVMSHSYPALLPATTLPIIRRPKYLKPKAEAGLKMPNLGIYGNNLGLISPRFAQRARRRRHPAGRNPLLV